jgi:hypothetical protein
MTSRAVIILTEPEQCELAGPDVLVQAMLEVQQLSKAGLAGSQAFCDHPAAAMKFIEAYTKAYPELQLRSSDLPPPEQLYSIVADGRVMPLRAPATLEGAKPGEASQLYPLYVLSLGAPDALMRALQHNSFAKSDIQLVEIAPVEGSEAGSVSVADAVAHDRRSSWRAETSAEREPEDDDTFASEERVASDSLKLDSVEVDLDRIQIDRRNGQEDHPDRASNEPAQAVVVMPSASALPADPDGGTPISSTGTTGNIASDLSTLTAPVSAAALDPGGTSPSLPPGGTSPSVGQAGVLPDTSAIAPTGDAGIPAEPAEEGETPAEASGGGESPASGEIDAPQDPAEVETDPGDVGRHGTPDIAAGPDNVPTAPEEASEPETRAHDEMASRTEIQSFGDLGGDIAYPPNASFALAGDVNYPLPPGAGLGGLLEDFFDRSGDGDVVDLEAILGGLSEPLGATTAALEEFDARLMAARGDSRRGADDGAGPDVAPDPSAPPYTDGSEPDREDAGQQRLPVGHDLDI